MCLGFKIHREKWVSLSSTNYIPHRFDCLTLKHKLEWWFAVYCNSKGPDGFRDVTISLKSYIKQFEVLPALRISRPTASSPICPLHSSRRVDTDSWLVRLWRDTQATQHTLDTTTKTNDAKAVTIA